MPSMATAPDYRLSARGHACACVAKPKQVLATSIAHEQLLAHPEALPRLQIGEPPVSSPSFSFCAAIEKLQLVGEISRHRSVSAQLLVPQASPAPCGPCRPARIASCRRNLPWHWLPPWSRCHRHREYLTMASPLQNSSHSISWCFGFLLMPCCSLAFSFYLYHPGFIRMPP